MKKFLKENWFQMGALLLMVLAYNQLLILSDQIDRSNSYADARIRDIHIKLYDMQDILEGIDSSLDIVEMNSY